MTTPDRSVVYVGIHVPSVIADAPAALYGLADRDRLRAGDRGAPARTPATR